MLRFFIPFFLFLYFVVVFFLLFAKFDKCVAVQWLLYVLAIYVVCFLFLVGWLWLSASAQLVRPQSLELLERVSENVELSLYREKPDGYTKCQPSPEAKTTKINQLSSSTCEWLFQTKKEKKTKQDIRKKEREEKKLIPRVSHIWTHEETRFQKKKTTKKHKRREGKNRFT